MIPRAARTGNSLRFKYLEFRPFFRVHLIPIEESTGEKDRGFDERRRRTGDERRHQGGGENGHL
jgi:hypothetical protein